MFGSGYKAAYVLNGSGGEIPSLKTYRNAAEILITGTAQAVASYTIGYSGTPNIDTTIQVYYKGSLDITTNGANFSILGQSLNQNDLNRELEITFRWSGASWIAITKKDFKETGIIEASHMSSDSVATAVIQDDAVTTDKIADLNVTTIKIAADAVDKTKIAADVAGLGLSQAAGGELNVNVDNTTIEVSADAIQVKDLGITTTKINDLAVTTGKIADLAVTTAKINDNAVTTVKVLDNNITNAKLAQMPTLTVKANITGGTANAADVAISTLFSNDTTKWSLLGNAGTTPGTNFIGTTDAQDLVFKTNNTHSGRIGLATFSTSFGFASNLNHLGIANTSFGYNALNIIGGTNPGNTAFGAFSLENATSAGDTTAVGTGALQNNTSGSDNTGVGAEAGDTITTGDNNTIIGSGADVSSAGALNRIAIGVGANATADFQFALPDNVVTWKVLGNNQALPQSGTYTPTLTNVTNVAASTAYPCQYMRVGSTVTVSGKVTIDPTATSATELGMSLPVVSNFANEEECAGTAADNANNNHPVRIIADSTNNRAAFVFTPSGSTSADYAFIFMYQII